MKVQLHQEGKPIALRPVWGNQSYLALECPEFVENLHQKIDWREEIDAVPLIPI